MNGAAIALLKLQDTYQLSTNDIAKGIVNNKQFNYEFSTDEYFLMGNQSFHYDLHNNSILWFGETLKRMENDTQSEKGNMIKYDMLGSMALSYYHQGNLYSMFDLLTFEKVLPVKYLLVIYVCILYSIVYFLRKTGKLYLGNQFENVYYIS